VISRRDLFTSLFDKARTLTGSEAPTLAKLERRSCLAWQRSFCTVCIEHCPIRGAITLDKGRPVIHAEACDGCGLCQKVCPSPINAITLVP
jgi:ferredoxin